MSAEAVADGVVADDDDDGVVLLRPRPLHAHVVSSLVAVCKRTEA